MAFALWPWTPAFLLEEGAEAWGAKARRGKEAEKGVHTGRRAGAQSQIVQLDCIRTGFLAAALKGLKTPASRSLHLPTGCQRPNPGLPCPTWLSGCLRSLGGTCSLSPALLCLHQALGTSSSRPSVSASRPLQVIRSPWPTCLTPLLWPPSLMVWD